MYKNTKDLIGQKFGLLTVVRLATEEERPKTKQKRVYWMCDCECGKSHVVSAENLVSGGVQSCGCLRTRNRAKIADSIVGKKIWTFRSVKLYNGKRRANPI